jgi:hypothetical protein
MYKHMIANVNSKIKMVSISTTVESKVYFNRVLCIAIEGLKIVEVNLKICTHSEEN